LNAAYVDGLISTTTFSERIEEALRAPVVDRGRLVGDLRFRPAPGTARDRISRILMTFVTRVDIVLHRAEPAMVLALDWSGEPRELLIGRSPSCDIVLSELQISRRHARLVFRDGRWLYQDLASTNGSVLNGRRVGRCELRPGDRLLLGQALLLRVD
jgi:hypothetical protein